MDIVHSILAYCMQVFCVEEARWRFQAAYFINVLLHQKTSVHCIISLDTPFSLILFIHSQKKQCRGFWDIGRPLIMGVFIPGRQRRWRNMMVGEFQ